MLNRTFYDIFRKPLKSKSENHLVNLSISFTLYFGKSFEKIMKIWRVIITIGMIVSFMGVIFHLQGQSIIGPESSFMYSNPEWISYGMQIVIVGMIIIGAGIFIKFKKLI